MDINVFVRGGNNGNYEGMTKEEILAAIAQAIQQGTVGDVDTGFVTTIKEQNRGQGLMFWVGTTAEYEALEERPNNVLYIKTDDTSAADISARFTQLTTAIETITGNLENFAPVDHASTATTYGVATITNYGHVRFATSLSDEADTTNRVPTAAQARSLRRSIDTNTSNIAANASGIAALQAAYKVPVGTILISATYATESTFADAMGYGTWELLVHDTITKTGGDQVDAFYYQRTV